MKTDIDNKKMLCPNGCPLPVNCNATKYGMKVRLCTMCNHSWISNPVLDMLQQARAIRTWQTSDNFTDIQLQALDQMKAKFRECGHELS